eukprot:68821_2
MLRRGGGALEFAAALEQLGAPRHCVVKPAIGGRGDGVERLRTCEGCPEWLVMLMRTYDFLIQPFLPAVTRQGEICLVFVNGHLLHAVRKDPGGWGAAAGHPSDAGVGAKLVVPGAGLLAHECVRQSIQLLDPPPADLVALGRRVLGFVAERCDGMPYLARVDLLPAGAVTAAAAADPSSDKQGASCRQSEPPWRWVVSELELGWPELFLRASSDAAHRVARELLEHLPPSEGKGDMPRQEPVDEEELRVSKRQKSAKGLIPWACLLVWDEPSSCT